jgi:hypothetical protein
LPDLIAFILLQGALVVLSLAAVIRDPLIVKRERQSGLVVGVTRGEQSMNSLYVIYGVATVMYSLVAQVASGLDGWRAAVTVIDYALLTHLFFFSPWFRNRFLFRLLRRAAQG